MLLALAGGQPLRGQTAAPSQQDAKFLLGLRERRLFELAETYCAQRLRDPALSAAAQGDLTIELIRAYSLHAWFAPAQEREKWWALAKAVAADFQRRSPQHPRRIQVRMHAALTLLSQGELARQEWEAGGGAAQEAARQSLREASRLLDDLDKELTREIPLRRRTPLAEGESTAEELTNLQRQCLQQLARVRRNQGLLYEPGSNDRVAALLQAVETLSRLLAQLDPEDLLALEARLDLCVCQRLLGKLDPAREQIADLDHDGVPPPVALRARAEEIRLLLAEKKPQEAQKLLAAGRKVREQTSAELDFAIFETYVALWQGAAAAHDEPASQAWQQKAADFSRFLEQTHGVYWSRRADQLLIRAAPSTGGTNWRILSRTADDLYLKKELDPAVAAYEKAGEQARQAAQLNEAYDLLFKAALVQEQRQLHSDAAARFRALSLGMKLHPQAAAAHLRGAWNLGAASDADPRLLDQYEAWLAEHGAVWPRDETTAQSRLWLGRLHQSQAKWAEAARDFQAVQPDSPHFAAAATALVPCWRQELLSLSAANKNTAEPAAAAVTFFCSLLMGTDGKLPEKWSSTQRLAATTAAEILLDYLPARAAEAQGILQAALNGAQGAPQEWQTEAQVLLIVSLAGQPGRRKEAQVAFAQTAAAAPRQLLRLVQGLSSIAARSRAESRRELASLQLQAAELLLPHREQLQPAERLTLERERALALAALDKRTEALAALAELAAKNPQNGVVQESYAELLLAGDDQPSLTSALDQWRRVAKGSQPRTQRWFRAKYSIALAQFKLGQKSAAATLLKYELATPPGLEGAGWQQAYEELLRQCGE